MHATLSAAAAAVVLLLVTVPLAVGAPAINHLACRSCLDAADEMTNCKFDLSCLCSSRALMTFSLCHDVCYGTDDDPIIKCNKADSAPTASPFSSDSTPTNTTRCTSSIHLAARSAEPQIAALNPYKDEDDEPSPVSNDKDEEPTSLPPVEYHHPKPPFGGADVRTGYLGFCGVDGAACAFPYISRVRDPTSSTVAHYPKHTNTKPPTKDATLTLQARQYPSPTQTSLGTMGFCGVDGAPCGKHGGVTPTVAIRQAPTQTSVGTLGICGPDGASCSKDSKNTYQVPELHGNFNEGHLTAHIERTLSNRHEDHYHWKTCDPQSNDIVRSFLNNATPMCGFVAPSSDTSDPRLPGRYDPASLKNCCVDDDQAEDDACFRYCAVADTNLDAFSNCISSFHPNVSVVCNGAMTGDHSSGGNSLALEGAQFKVHVGAFLLLLSSAALF